MSNSLTQWMYERDRYTIEGIKLVLTLASGTFIVTLSFIGSRPHATYKGLILISWVFLICSIIFGMWAISAGVTRYDNAIKGELGELAGKAKILHEKGKVLTPFEAQTPGLQQWSFTIGLVSFFSFVVLNTFHELKW